MRPRQGDVGNRLPDPGAGFIWDTGQHGVGTYPVLRPATDDCEAVYTTRRGGVSLEPFDELNVSTAVGDAPYRVLANRDLAARTIGRGAAWSTVKQVHGGDVVAAHGMGRHRPADAQWTDEPSPTLAVFAADCVLLLLVGPLRIGVAHAGWRGLVAGVIENAIDAVQPSVVYAGPAIGPCCFEVGPEVVDAFSSAYGDAIVDARHIDLWSAATIAARRRGIETVYSARLCTACHPELFFSHRRDDGLTGRQALLARLPDA